MKNKDLKDKPEKELHNLLAKDRDNVRDLRFKAAVGSLREVRKIRESKKTIARILTALNKKK